MWAIIKFNKKDLNLLKEDLGKKLGSAPEIYIPKLQLQYVRQNKHFKKDFFILGDYLFCFHESFKSMKVITSLKYCKGLVYFLDGFKSSQREIKNFIFKCSSNEDKKGYLKQTFFELCTKKDFKFVSGPFTDVLFKIISIQKNKLEILVGNIVMTISDKKNYLYRPV
jgi:hypothetical protein